MFYSRNLANEVIKGSVQKANAGGTLDKAPTGCLNARKIENGREDRTVVVDPVRGPLMKWAFNEYATGKWNLRNLLAEATKRGLNSTATYFFADWCAGWVRSFAYVDGERVQDKPVGGDAQP